MGLEMMHCPMRLIPILLLILLATSCGDPLVKGLDAWADQPPGTVLPMTEVVTAEWDSLYIFGPYTGPDDIDAALGFHWDDPRASRLEMYDDAAMLLFVRKGEVVRALIQPRRPDMTGLARPEPYSRDEARFVCRVDGSGWIWADLAEE